MPYAEAKLLLNEGDILLFRGQGLISTLIGLATDTPYSHVGIASWINGEDSLWMCVEFREGKGGRSINLENEVKRLPEQIDVYRPAEMFDSYVFDKETKRVKKLQRVFDGKKVTRIMQKATGLPYSFKRVWWMTKRKLIIFRLFKKYFEKDLIDDKMKEMVFPVCSTVVAHAFNANGYDLINNRSDEASEPGDIAKSTRTNYLFTLAP